MSTTTYLPERKHKKPARRHTTRKTTVRPFNFGCLTNTSEKNEVGPESEIKSKLVIADRPEIGGSENPSVTSSQLPLFGLLSKLQTEVLGVKANKENEPLLKNSNNVKSPGKTVQSCQEPVAQLLTSPIQHSTNISLQKSPTVLVHKLVLSPEIIEKVSSTFRVSQKSDCSVSENPQGPSPIKVTEIPALGLHKKSPQQIVSSNISIVPTTIELSKRDASHSPPPCQSSISSSSETLSNLENQVSVKLLAKSSNSKTLSTLQQSPGKLRPIPEESVGAISYTATFPYPNNDTRENGPKHHEIPLQPKPVPCDTSITKSPAKSYSSNRRSPRTTPRKNMASGLSSESNHTSNVVMKDEENMPSKSSTLTLSSILSPNGSKPVLNKSTPIFGKESPTLSKVNASQRIYKESQTPLSRETSIEANSSPSISEKQTSAAGLLVDGDAIKQASFLGNVNVSPKSHKTVPQQKPISCDTSSINKSPVKPCSSNRRSPRNKPDTGINTMASGISSEPNYASNVTKKAEENMSSKISTFTQSSVLPSNGTESVLAKSAPVFGKELLAPSKVNSPKRIYKESQKPLSRETSIEPNSSPGISEKQTSASGLVVDGDAAEQPQAEFLINVDLSLDRTKSKRLSPSKICIENETQLLLSKPHQEMQEKTPEETLQSISEFLNLNTKAKKVLETHRKESPVKSCAVSLPSVSTPEKVSSYEIPRYDSALRSSVKIVSATVEPGIPVSSPGPELPASDSPLKSPENILFPKVSRKRSPVIASAKAFYSTPNSEAPTKESELVVSFPTPNKLQKDLSPKTSRKDSPVKSGTKIISPAAKLRKKSGSELSVSVPSVSKSSYEISRKESALKSSVKIVSARVEPGTLENNSGPELSALNPPSKISDMVSFLKTSRKHSPFRSSAKTFSSTAKPETPVKESETELVVSVPTPSELQKVFSPKTRRKDSPVKSGAKTTAEPKISRRESAPLSVPNIQQIEGEKLKEKAVVLSVKSSIKSPVKSKSLSPSKSVSSLLKEAIGSHQRNIRSESGSATSKEFENTLSIATINASNKRDLSQKSSLQLNINEKPESDRLSKEAPDPPLNDSVMSKSSQLKSSVSRKLDFTEESSKLSAALSFGNSNNSNKGLSINEPVTQTDHNLKSPNSKTRKGTSSERNISSSSDDANQKEINVPAPLSERSRLSPRKLASNSCPTETQSALDVGQQLPTHEQAQVRASVNPGMICDQTPLKEGSEKSRAVKKRPTALSDDQIQNGMNMSPTVSPKSVCIPKKMKLDAEHLVLSSDSDSELDESQAKEVNRVVLVGGKMSSTPKPSASKLLPYKRKLSEFFRHVDVNGENSLEKNTTGKNTRSKSKEDLEFSSRTQEKRLKDVSGNTRSNNQRRKPTGILKSDKSSRRKVQNTDSTHWKVNRHKVVKANVGATGQGPNRPKKLTTRKTVSKKKSKKIPEKYTEKNNLHSVSVGTKLPLDPPQGSDSDQRQIRKNLDIQNEQNKIESVQQLPQNVLESDRSENRDPVGSLVSEDEENSWYLQDSLNYDPEDLLDEVHKFQLKLRVSTKGAWPLKTEQKPRKKVKPKTKPDAGLIRYWMGHPLKPRPKKPLDLDLFATALEEAILEMRENIDERDYEYLLQYQAAVEFELHKDIEKVERFILGQKKIKKLEKRIQLLQEVHSTHLKSN